MKENRYYHLKQKEAIRRALLRVRAEESLLSEKGVGGGENYILEE